MGKNLVVIILTIMVISVLSACSGATPTPEPVAANAVEQPKVVSAEAYVVPVKKANLSFESGGRVVAVAADEDQSVEAGKMLVQLDDATERAQLNEAKANLSQMEAKLTEAAAGLSQAQASLAKVKADPTKEEIAQLKAGLDSAQAALDQLVVGPKPQEIAQSEAAVRTAQAQLNELLAKARQEDLQSAGARLLQTQADVRQSQQKYDEVRYGDPDDVLVAGVALEKATLAYEAAQADYDKLAHGATPEQIATAKSRVAEAQAALAVVKSGATPEQIAQAQAAVARAQADLDKLLAGATDEDIAIAEAQVETSQASVESVRASVDAAKSQVESAQVQVNKRQLVAPFAGVVGSVDVEVGEVVQPGSSAVSLGDTGKWQIETDDLTEIDVVNVQPGAKVTIKVDALPGEEFEGKVVRVKPKSETKAGDVTYTVLIDITKGSTSRLRWGMTTYVDIEADSGIPR